MNDATCQSPALISVPDVAARLGISERSAWRMIAGGDFGPEVIRLGARIVRVRSVEVDAWIEAGCPSRAAWAWRAAK